jgi:superfamily II DNA/RNA helicase
LHLSCFPQEEAVKFSAAAGIKCVCLYGGASKGPQIRDLRFGADLCICTPGRLLDLSSMVCRFENTKIMTLEKARCSPACIASPTFSSR